MTTESEPTKEAKKLLGLAEGRRQYVGLFLLVLSLVSSLAALLIFPQSTAGSSGWTFHTAGIILFALAVPLLFRGAKDIEPAEPLNLQVVIFGLIILGLAVFLRFYRLAELPFGTWYDEAEIGLRAKQILLDPVFRPVFLRGHALTYHFPSLVALSFQLLGVSTQSVRVVTVLFGLGSVVVAFFLGREIYGNRFGLLMAFFFAVARWSLIFDRLGMATSSGPFFLMLVLLLLIHGRRTSSPRYFAWAGLIAGVGLGFHSSLRLFPLVILVFLGYWIADQVRRHGGARSWRIVWGVDLAVLALGALVAAGPLIQVAIRQPDDFWNRTRQVSIFEKRDEPNLARAIGSNTIKNVLMFNYQGDRNGRHNLPGEPMLDPVTGALFVLGFALALSRFRRPAEMLFVVVFVVGLTAAILTVDFESPQAQRSIGATAAVYFFAALAVEAYWRMLDRSPSPFWARPLGLAMLVLGGAVIVYANSNTYFVRQANDSSVWQSHSTIETIAARKIAAFDPEETTLYLSMFMEGHPVINFLAPDHKTKVIAPPDILPLREPGDRPVAVLTDLGQAWIAEEIDRFYPNAQLTIASNPNGSPMQYTVVVPPEDIRQAQGLTARYWPGHEAKGQPEISRIEDTVNARWPAEAPLDGPFLAEWAGVLYAPEFGDYELLLQSPGPATLSLDGETLIESEEGGEHHLVRTLPQGNHDVQLMAESGEGVLRLAWTSPGSDEQETVPAWSLYHGPQVTSQGLLGSFYEGGDWNTTPALQRIDPTIDAYFHLLPLERPYGVIWAGQIEIPEDGLYTFGLEVNGQAQLFVDDRLVVDAPEPTEYVEGAIDLEAGRREVRLQFLDNVGGSRLHLYWTPPGQERQIIPADFLFPAPPTE